MKTEGQSSKTHLGDSHRKCRIWECSGKRIQQKKDIYRERRRSLEGVPVYVVGQKSGRETGQKRRTGEGTIKYACFSLRKRFTRHKESGAKPNRVQLQEI